MFESLGNALQFKYMGELLRFEAIGKNGIRVRATKNIALTGRNWAIQSEPHAFDNIEELEGGRILRNGKLSVHIDRWGKMCFYDANGRLLLKERYRTGERGDDEDNMKHHDDLMYLHHDARRYKANGGQYRLTVRFDADDNERLYGMGQYQQSHLNLKGCMLELAQYNTQASVPFLYSSKGYGMLWNNPGIGTATFGYNMTQWQMQGTQEMDYWITAGDSIDEIECDYADVTGHAPMMPESAMGFWQCKLRYSTQEEVLQVAREYKRRNIPIDIIVIDFFHWTNQGEWRFDPKYWPDPKAMVRELREMGIRPVISVWPTVDLKSEFYTEMKERDLLIRTDRGLPVAADMMSITTFLDSTNPEARRYLWDKCRKNYLENGIDMFWLDVAEPEYTVDDFDIYRYYAGPAVECANIFPAEYTRCFYEGLREAGVEAPVNLVRCAWAGSQRYGALAWSGDVPSTFVNLRNQIPAGLNMGLAGIPWWCSDIGGFNGGDIRDPKFKELLMRWFAFGTFVPVMRLHGDRLPQKEPLSHELGGGMCPSGADNEVWSYGDECERIMTRFIHARYAMKPYISELMKAAHEFGTPVIRPLFYHFAEDENAWAQEDSYLFGPDLLVAPVYTEGAQSRDVYLPAGTQWQDVYSGKVYEGGCQLTADAPIDRIPLFARKGSAIYDLLAVLREE